MHGDTPSLGGEQPLLLATQVYLLLDNPSRDPFAGLHRLSAALHRSLVTVVRTLHPVSPIGQAPVSDQAALLLSALSAAVAYHGSAVYADVSALDASNQAARPAQAHGAGAAGSQGDKSRRARFGALQTGPSSHTTHLACCSHLANTRVTHSPAVSDQLGASPVCPTSEPHEPKAGLQRSSDVQLAERERQQWWDGLTPEQQRRHDEEQAAQWQRHWKSLTPAQQEDQRRKWKEDWDRHWNGLTAAQQQEQRRKWAREREVKQAAKREDIKPAV